jgi:hypothetical protein
LPFRADRFARRRSPRLGAAKQFHVDGMIIHY